MLAAPASANARNNSDLQGARRKGLTMPPGHSVQTPQSRRLSPSRRGPTCGSAPRSFAAATEHVDHHYSNATGIWAIRSDFELLKAVREGASAVPSSAPRRPRQVSPARRVPVPAVFPEQQHHSLAARGLAGDSWLASCACSASASPPRSRPAAMSPLQSHRSRPDSKPSPRASSHPARDRAVEPEQVLLPLLTS